MNTPTPSDHDNLPGPPVAQETDPRVIWGGAAGILAVLAGLFVFTHGGSSKPEPKSAVAQTVTVATVTPQPFAKRITLSGQARPRLDIRVFAPASGVRITKLLVEEGAMVAKGQPLAQLDARVAEAQISAAAASVAEAESASVRAADEYRRAESIKDSGALSAEAINARKAAAAAAAARLASARAQQAEINARLEGGYIRAPDAGLVIQRTAQVGQLVDGQILFRIAGNNALELGAEIGEADMLAIKPGIKASFALIDGSTVNAVLRRAPASIDTKSRTGEAVFDLAPDPRLRAGMVLRGELSLPAAEALAAAQTAVSYVDRQATVFVLSSDNRVQRRTVSVGAHAGDMVAIEQGLKAGETIVIGGAAFLQDGDLVTPVRGTASSTSSADPAPKPALRGREG